MTLDVAGKTAAGKTRLINPCSTLLLAEREQGIIDADALSVV